MLCMAAAEEPRPRIVCLCGSTRFLDAFDAASLEQTLAGRIVLSIGSTRVSDVDVFAGQTEAEQSELRQRLAALHRAKIDLADEVLVINVGGYIGEATAAEVDYARSTGTAVSYLEPPSPHTSTIR